MKQAEPFGKFLLLGQVAVGGMAEIYKAKYADPGMPQDDIALKRILPSYTEDEGFVTMFKDEGNIAIRLKHPNIVNIYEVGEVDNDWYIAMEFIHGTDIRILSDACEKYNKRFTPTQIARIVCETAKALDYAHSCTAADGTPLNIVHRDCTPHNIMVSYDNSVKLTDFGIAKAASRATKTRIGTVKGKSSYMSPEQARGKTLDGRSDMFTLGTVAWELLTGYRLFKASTDFDILQKVLKSPIIHPSDLDSNIPRDLGDIVMRTLERDRDARYANCGEMAAALENWISSHGDGSDQHLGEYVLALTNKRGHTYTELPDYVPGESLYDCVDDNFIKKGVPVSAGETTGVGIGGVAASTANFNAQPNPVYAPQAPQAPVFQEPAPSVTNKVSTLFIFLYIFLTFVTAGAAFFGYTLYQKIGSEEVTYAVPEASINLKSKPSKATVYINGEKYQTDGRDALTPVYSLKHKLGDNINIRFEKEGYETVEIERKVVQMIQDIDVNLLTPEEAAEAKLSAIPKFVITTSPEGLLVSVNGEDKGKSPVTLENVAYGAQLKIVVTTEEKNIEPVEQYFYASKDGDKTLNIVVDKASTVVAKGGKKDKEPKAKPNVPAKPKAPVAEGDGTLSIKATPWAMVTVDSEKKQNARENAPVVVKLPAGSHKVELKQPQLGKSTSKSVTIKPAQTVSIHYDFNTESWK